MPPSNRFRDVSSAKTLVLFLFLAFYLVNFRSLKDLFVYLGVFLSYRSTGSSWNQLYSLYERTASFINVHIPLLNIFFIISGQDEVGGWVVKKCFFLSTFRVKNVHVEVCRVGSQKWSKFCPRSL